MGPAVPSIVNVVNDCDVPDAFDVVNARALRNSDDAATNDSGRVHSEVSEAAL